MNASLKLGGLAEKQWWSSVCCQGEGINWCRLGSRRLQLVWFCSQCSWSVRLRK